ISRLQLGSAIVEIFLRVAKVNVNLMKEKAEEKFIPAFYHVYVFQKQRQVGFIKPHPNVMKLGKFLMETSMLPMLVPSRPWLCHHDGGYVATPAPIMRYREDCFDQDVLLAKSSRKLRSIYDSINYLGSCPWKVNKRVLDKCIECFNETGSDILDIPDPRLIPMPPYPVDPDIEPQEKRRIIELRRQVAKKQREHHSLRMDVLYKLSVAKHFENDIFWLPHNMDFRGRVYPIPPHLSHVGNDLSRSLMLFAIGRPLGTEGFDWIKVHLANVHGQMSKASLTDRINFTESLKNEILDSADNPFTGDKWWQTGEHPWQTLATCMELADVWRCDNPEQYISYFPVHQDGTCNGLQHYAALGRDTLGAEQVNLVSRGIPQDIYSAVARLVEEHRAKDAKKNNFNALWLEGKVSRKVVKQTVMTIVYGVTRVGGREQIARQLERLQELENEERIFTASQYLVRIVFDQLSKMFYSARRIQEWLNDSARQIASAGSLVEWITPLGLPVLQPYRVPVYKEVHFNRVDVKPHVSKQKMAFPPNYIHSLDSTHMMLTSLECQASDTTFVAVHDSFWTHAATVNELNRICRKQFIKLHQEPLLEDLEKFLCAKFDGQL
ncbi:uncharacterized protein TRIADDRAFT_25308, partial [Trichoplax adhaerens]